ncbi:MAG: hypothetical protein J7577_13790 [Sphingobacteriaceae bacterium]|nr:hypothetical protein [Sphingobacteriaceae bacterium]
MNCKSTYSGQKHSKWAILFALFLSLFTFSNSISNSIIFQRNPGFQTEWVYQKRKRFIALAIAQKAWKKTAARKKEYFVRMLAFNKLLALKLTKLAEASLSIPAIASLFIKRVTLSYPVETDPAS